MPEFLTDQEIGDLLAEPKPLPNRLAGANLGLRDTKAGHREAEVGVIGASGSEFGVIVRQSKYNTLDFSVILGYVSKTTNRVFRLRRYNGRSHQHTNRIEEVTFYDFHVHTATERYQVQGLKEETYAEPTDRYCDLRGAVDCLVEDCGFQRSSSQPPRLL